MNYSGIINIYKEKGFTSHDVVNIVRNSLNKIKTGHTGTLDPDAEGVLPICIGKATKLADYITATQKQYRAKIKLGITTTTEDISGDILTKSDVNISEEEFISATMSFVGEYDQKPPMFSAVKVKGKKLYELAREGKEIERKTRRVTIYNISEIKRLSDSDYEMLIDCSKGTYIRTLCSDIGKKLGCGGIMSELTRTRTGNFYLKDSIKIEEFRNKIKDNALCDILIPMESILSEYKKVTVDVEAEKYIMNGNPISLSYLSDIPKENETIVVFNSDKRLCGLYSKKGKYIKPLKMLI